MTTSDSRGAPRDRGRRGGSGRERRGREAGPDAPGAARGRAGGGDPSLPFRPSRAASGRGSAGRRLPVPRLPTDHEVDLPKGVVREVERQVVNPQTARQVVVALSLATRQTLEGDLDAAAQLLEWARQEAPRSASVREALAIVRYQQERFQDALRELQTYQRLTGRKDQNHLLADVHRALGHDVDLIADAVSAMADSFPDRYVEGLIVWASALADRGEPGAGAALLRREADEPLRRRAGAEAATRLRYVEADLAARSGRVDEAIRGFEEVVSALGEDEAWDAPRRIAELESRRG